MALEKAWVSYLNIRKKSGEHPEKKIWVDATLKNLRCHPIKIWVDFIGYPSNHFSGCKLNGCQFEFSRNHNLKKKCLIMKLKEVEIANVNSERLCKHCVRI